MVFDMKVTLRKISIILTILFVGILTCSHVLAADMTVKVNCDGKTIKMTSETPDLTWKIENILPGESDESTLTIQNIGKKKVDVDVTVKIESGEELAKILNLQITKKQVSTNTEETVFNGKYSELKTLTLNLDISEKAIYTFKASLPTETGNEFQGKESVIKFALVASGEQDVPKTPDKEPEKKPEETPKIITDKVELPQTGEGIIIYIIVGVLLIASIVALVTLILNKRDKNK